MMCCCMSCQGREGVRPGFPIDLDADDLVVPVQFVRIAGRNSGGAADPFDLEPPPGVPVGRRNG